MLRLYQELNAISKNVSAMSLYYFAPSISDKKTEQYLVLANCPILHNCTGLGPYFHFVHSYTFRCNVLLQVEC